MQFTIVSEVPLDACGACCATSVENKGESAITVIPQTNKQVMSNVGDAVNKKSGEHKQHKQEMVSAIVATFFAPKICESKPLATQANAPIPIMVKDSSDTFNAALG